MSYIRGDDVMPGRTCAALVHRLWPVRERTRLARLRAGSTRPEACS